MTRIIFAMCVVFLLIALTHGCDDEKKQTCGDKLVKRLEKVCPPTFWDDPPCITPEQCCIFTCSDCEIKAACCPNN